MSSTIESFDGTTIEGSYTSDPKRPKVFAAFDWERLVLPPLDDAIRRKSKEVKGRLDPDNRRPSGRLLGFPPEDHGRLVEKLGHYSDVQSLSGEDTVTWSVFGTAAGEGWLNEMLDEVFGRVERPKCWEVKHWRRIPHPRTGQVEHGPESDVVLQGTSIVDRVQSSWRYVIEAKWTADISRHEHGETQIDMRAYHARLNDMPPERSGVLIIVPSPARYDCASAKASIFGRYFKPECDGYSQLRPAEELNARTLTWERLVDIIADRGRPNLQAYMRWRLSQTFGIRGASRGAAVGETT